MNNLMAQSESSVSEINRNPDISMATSVWESMKAEYPQQWSKAMGDGVTGSNGSLTIIAGKWLKATKEAEGLSIDGSTTFKMSIVSRAIELLQGRPNADYLPTLGAYRKCIQTAKKEHNLKVQHEKNRADVKKKNLLADENEDERCKQSATLNRLVIHFMMAISISDRSTCRKAKSSFFECGGSQALWNKRITELGIEEAY